MKKWNEFVEEEKTELDILGEEIDVLMQKRLDFNEEEMCSCIKESLQQMSSKDIEKYLDKHFMTKDRLICMLEEEGCSRSGLEAIGINYIVSYTSEYEYMHPVTQTYEIGNIYVNTTDGIVKLPFFETNTEGGYEQIETDFATVVPFERLSRILAEELKKAIENIELLNLWR